MFISYSMHPEHLKCLFRQKRKKKKHDQLSTQHSNTGLNCFVAKKKKNNNKTFFDIDQGIE